MQLFQSGKYKEAIEPEIIFISKTKMPNPITMSGNA